MAEKVLLNHPKLQQMRALGLDNEEQLQIAMLAYLHLTEVKLWDEVVVLPCAALNMVYLRTRQNKDSSEVTCVLPLPAYTQPSLESLSGYVKALQECGGGAHNTVTLALVETDTTIVYYNISVATPKATQPMRDTACSNTN